MFCPECGAENPDGAEKCGNCGRSLVFNFDYEKTERTYSDKKNEFPGGIDGFNFGAFALTWIWALGNRMWLVAGVMLGLLVLTLSAPIFFHGDTGIYNAFVFIAYVFYKILVGHLGNRYAWKTQHFESEKQFWRIQNAWVIAGHIYFWPFCLLLSFSISYPSFTRARDNAKFTQCLESLAGVKVAEEFYFTDHDTFTTDKDRLGIHMIAGCTDPTGKAPNCNGQVNTRIKNNCNKDVGWEIVPGSTGDMNSYYLKATAGDRFNCKICVAPDGYAPTSFKICATKPPMKCPERGKN